MPNPACCDAQKRENRSEVLQDALGAFHEQREPPRNLHRYAMEQKTEKARSEREAPKSVRQRFVLSARDTFLLFFLFLL